MFQTLPDFVVFLFLEVLPILFMEQRQVDDLFAKKDLLLILMIDEWYLLLVGFLFEESGIPFLIVNTLGVRSTKYHVVSKYLDRSGNECVEVYAFFFLRSTTSNMETWTDCSLREDVFHIYLTIEKNTSHSYYVWVRACIGQKHTKANALTDRSTKSFLLFCRGCAVVELQ